MTSGLSTARLPQRPQGAWWRYSERMLFSVATVPRRIYLPLREPWWNSLLLPSVPLPGHAKWPSCSGTSLYPGAGDRGRVPQTIWGLCDSLWGPVMSRAFQRSVATTSLHQVSESLIGFSSSGGGERYRGSFDPMYVFPYFFHHLVYASHAEFTFFQPKRQATTRVSLSPSRPTFPEAGEAECALCFLKRGTKFNTWIRNSKIPGHRIRRVFPKRRKHMSLAPFVFAFF